MSSLFTPATFGAITTTNKIMMSPMTRGRADTVTAVPTERMIQYYADRADAGLIITEATGISRQGLGWNGAPGIWTDDQQAAWGPIVEAVHARGGKIAVQLWHMGRASHSDFNDGALPVAASAIALSGHTYTPQGKKPYETPRALEASEIPGIVEGYAQAALRARAAGFDIVEIHGANGYLLDNFLRDSSNRRSDDFGGSIENRARFQLQVVDAVVQAIGHDRTALRLSPVNAYNDMSDSNPRAVFMYMAEQLNKFNLAFLDILEGVPGSMMHVAGDPIAPHMRSVYKGNLVVNGGYLKVNGQAALDAQAADAIAIGIPFIANPDLISRLQKDAPLAQSPMSTWYMGLDEGYNDFASLAA